MLRLLAACALLASAGCYHYTFEQSPAPTSLTSAGPVQRIAPQTVTYKKRVPTYLNGFVGNGRVYAYDYCRKPIRTELRVTATDVALALGTLFIYTPHTLYVTCQRSLTIAPRKARALQR